MRELAKVAGVNAADFVSIDDDGKPHLNLTGVKRAQMAAVASVDSETTEFGVKARVKMHDKLKALDMLAKMARLYPAEHHRAHWRRWRPDSIGDAQRAQDRHRIARAGLVSHTARATA